MVQESRVTNHDENISIQMDHDIKNNSGQLYIITYGEFGEISGEMVLGITDVDNNRHYASSALTSFTYTNLRDALDSQRDVLDRATDRKYQGGYFPGVVEETGSKTLSELGKELEDGKNPNLKSRVRDRNKTESPNLDEKMAKERPSSS